MSTTEFWDEAKPPGILDPPNEPLSEAQIGTLWLMFKAIPVHWKIKSNIGIEFDVELLRSRWLDMLEARGSGAPNYRGEYENAARVYDTLIQKRGEPRAIAKLYQRTLVTKPEQATTRLTHAKFYVANDFIRCFVATGGFRGFVPEARNYTGFMGGSRFREWDPVRTGNRK